MKEESKEQWRLGLLLSLLAVLVDMPLKMAVLWQLWVWFVMPLGVPTLTWAQMLGLGLVATLGVKFWKAPAKRRAKSNASRLEDGAHQLTDAILSPLCCLLSGWIVHCFM